MSKKEKSDGSSATSGQSSGPSHYRCRVEASVVAGDKSRNLGPGLVLTADEYNDLVSEKLVRPDMFEPFSDGEERTR